ARHFNRVADFYVLPGNGYRDLAKVLSSGVPKAAESQTKPIDSHSLVLRWTCYAVYANQQALLFWKPRCCNASGSNHSMIGPTA
ncbi:MAG: hypothetical protein KGQ60_11785, partial [Planctomycetes bacterium]|nr:hypothetical protein [Planctomycetota bacterium]